MPDILQTAAQTPEVFEVLCACARPQTNNDAEQNERDKRSGFRRRENILHEFAELQAARVHKRQ